MNKNKIFIFDWEQPKKYGSAIVRRNRIQADSAKTAVEIFMKEFGNLKKNKINSIQEVSPTGEKIGEPITSEN